MEHKEHHTRELKFFISFLVILLLVFTIAMINLNRGLAVFGLGIGYIAEDIVIIILSVLGIMKILWNVIVH
ncbi:MAG: hypothetical protein U9O94_00135 [Nanoarchaeota archaeon]|nr:hypothetical protein [Nanoarchaeota archaeon]